MNNLAILYINSGLSSFTAILVNKKRKFLGYTHGDITSCGEKREIELANMRLNVVNMVSECAKKSGITSIEIICKGPLFPRLIDIKALANNGVNVTLIKDKTPIPHNGIRPLRRTRAIK